MGRRAAGMTFMCIAAFLFGVHIVAAAILGSGMVEGSDMFHFWMDAVGKAPSVLALLALIMGIIYLIVAELVDSISRNGTMKRNWEKIKENWNEFPEDQ